MLNPSDNGRAFDVTRFYAAPLHKVTRGKSRDAGMGIGIGSTLSPVILIAGGMPFIVGGLLLTGVIILALAVIIWSLLIFSMVVGKSDDGEYDIREYAYLTRAYDKLSREKRKEFKWMMRDAWNSLNRCNDFNREVEIFKFNAEPVIAPVDRVALAYEDMLVARKAQEEVQTVMAQLMKGQ